MPTAMQTDTQDSSFYTFPAQKPPEKVTRGVHRCPHCPKVFKRSEHCARHQFSHTRQRPYSCQFCGKTYARKDLVKRHERTLHAEEYSKLVPASEAGANDEPSRPTRPPAPPSETARSPASPDLAPPETSAEEIEPIDGPTTSGSTTPAPSNGSQDTQAILPEGVAALSVSSATSRHSIHSVDDNSTQPHATSTDLQRPYETPSRREETNTSYYPIPQMPDPMSAAPIGLLDFAMDEIICANDVRQRQSRESAALTQRGYRSRRPRTGDGAQGSLAAESSNSIPNSDASYGAGQQPLDARMPSSVDPLTFIQSLDFFNLDLGMTTGGDFLHSQAMEMPERGFFNWQGGMAGHFDFPNQGTQQQTTSDDQSPPTPQSVGAAEQNGNDKQAKEASMRLPKVRNEKCVNPPRLTISENTYRRIILDTFDRLGQGDEDALPVNSCRELQQLVNGYVDYFHRHFPILHLASLVPLETPSPLIWAMCCIGALYRLDRQKARRIYRITARMLSAQFDDNGVPIPLNSPKSTNEWPWDDTHTKQATQMRPLWLIQARVLLSFYASLGEDTTVAVAEFERLGMFTKEYRLRRDYLRRQEPCSTLSWRDWIERESNKRLLCGMFIQSNLFVILYDILPGFDTTQDLDIEVLEEEGLWEVSTEEQWQTLRQKTTAPAKTIQTVLVDTLSGMTDDDSAPEPYSISGFTALTVIHAVNVHAWHLSQVSQTLSKGLKTRGYASNVLLSQTLTSLARCRDMLRQSRPQTVEPLWDDTEGPLLFSCEAMLRVAYTRLFTDVSMPQRFTLLCNSSEDRPAALRALVTAKQERSPLMTKAVAYALDSFFVPMKAGYLLVRKTAAFTWSVEHSIAVWGCAILLCRWIHCIETHESGDAPTEAEAQLLEQVKAALKDTECDYEEGRSLAAAVANAWASLNTDVWVWGITARLGQILAELSQAYESDYREHQESRMEGVES